MSSSGARRSAAAFAASRGKVDTKIRKIPTKRQAAMGHLHELLALQADAERAAADA